MARSVVPTGRRMAGSQMFMVVSLRRPLLRRFWRDRQYQFWLCRRGRFAADALPQALHLQIDHWRGVECQHLAEQQAADDGDSERIAQLGTGAALDRQRDGAE